MNGKSMITEHGLSAACATGPLAPKNAVSISVKMGLEM